MPCLAGLLVCGFACLHTFCSFAGLQPHLAGHRWQLHQAAAAHTLELQCRPCKSLARVPSPTADQASMDESQWEVAVGVCCVRPCPFTPSMQAPFKFMPGLKLRKAELWTVPDIRRVHVPTYNLAADASCTCLQIRQQTDMLCAVCRTWDTSYPPPFNTTLKRSIIVPYPIQSDLSGATTWLCHLCSCRAVLALPCMPVRNRCIPAIA